MTTHLLEGYFQLPAHHEPAEDLLRIGLKVATQEDLGLELSFGIAHQDPAHGYGEQARGVPHGRLGRDLDHGLPAPVPAGDRGRLPKGGGAFGYLRKVGQAFSLEARPPYLARASWRSRFVEGGIQAQTGDEGDRVREAPAALEQFERCVGAIGDSDDLTLRVAPPYYQEQLPGPLGYLLVPSTPLGGVALGRGQGREEG